MRKPVVNCDLCRFRRESPYLRLSFFFLALPRHSGIRYLPKPPLTWKADSVIPHSTSTRSLRGLSTSLSKVRALTGPSCRRNCGIKRIGWARTTWLDRRTRRFLVSALLGTLVALWSIPGKCETPPGTAAPGKSDPAAAECLEGGNKAADAGNFDEAIKQFTQCTEKFPNSAEAQFLLGMAHFYKQDMEKAITALKKSMQLDPNNPNATAMLGRIYSFDAQKLSLAKELLERGPLCGALQG